MNVIHHIAKCSDDAEVRRTLGYDLESCIRLKFPPAKVEMAITDVPYRISKSDVLLNDTTRWLVSTNKMLHVQRAWHKDAYSIDDIKYTHYFDYEDGRVRIWRYGTHFDEFISSEFLAPPP